MENIRREIQWLADEAANLTNFKSVLNPWEYGFEHKKTGFVIWRDGDLWKRRWRLPWVFSVHIAVSVDEQTLLRDTCHLLWSRQREQRRQNKMNKGTLVLTKSNVQSNQDNSKADPS